MENLPAKINYDDPKMIRTLQATVAQGASPEEFQMFCEFCKATNLNPFKKEIWFIKTKGYTTRDGKQVEGKVQMMTGINGYLAIANSHPQFDGMETFVERDEKTNKPIKAVCKVYRKDRRMPHSAEAYFEEYYRGGFNGKLSVWDEKPTIMIQKVAKSIALREAFPQEMNGLYTEEEMPAEYSASSVKITEVKEKEEAKPTPPPQSEVPFDDELPESFSDKKAYRYDLSSLEDAKRIPLEEWLSEKGCYLDAGIWVCPREIKKLESLEVVEDAAKTEADARAKLQALKERRNGTQATA